jgi:hypothetical protein
MKGFPNGGCSVGSYLNIEKENAMPIPYTGEEFTLFNPDGSEIRVRGWVNLKKGQESHISP